MSASEKELPVADTPEKAWYRAAALMRATIQTQGVLADDDPAWSVELPKYTPPSGEP